MKVIQSILLFLIFSTSTVAADSLWQFIPQKEIAVEGKRKIIPQQFIIVKLNDTLFTSIRSRVPAETSGDFALLPLPSPDHSIRSFRLTQNAVMAPELAAKYPELQTYSASEIGQPSVTARLDYTTSGFHAMVNDGASTYFIDPYSTKNTGYYICYYKKDYDNRKTLREETLQKQPSKKHKCRRK
jgi:hypothetical protein